MDTQEILTKHKLWLACHEDGERAILYGADLRGADIIWHGISNIPVVQCSECRITFCDIINNHHYMYRYCPFCGRTPREEICKIRQLKWKIFHVCITGWMRHAHQTYYSSLTKRGVLVSGTERDDK